MVRELSSFFKMSLRYPFPRGNRFLPALQPRVPAGRLLVQAPVPADRMRQTPAAPLRVPDAKITNIF